MIVAILTPQQKELIHGKQFDRDSSFNCVQDIYLQWVVSQEEIIRAKSEFSWLWSCPFTSFIPNNQEPI